jgi:tetratricopeptide (TPR) repeat protein
LSERYPHAALVHLLAAEAHWRRGDEAAGEVAYRRYLPGRAEGLMKYVRHSPFAHYVPGDAALACVQLRLPELALRVLRRGVNEVKLANEKMALEMAESYLEAGQALLRQGQTERMVQALSLSLAIHPHKVAYNMLATTAFERGDYARAVAGWRRSLAIDERQADTHATLGQVLLAKLDERGEALAHLRRAVELDPARAADLEKWLAAARDKER